MKKFTIQNKIDGEAVIETLSEAARFFYNGTDNLNIYKKDGLFFISGDQEADDMTAHELEEWLEADSLYFYKNELEDFLKVNCKFEAYNIGEYVKDVEEFASINNCKFYEMPADETKSGQPETFYFNNQGRHIWEPDDKKYYIVDNDGDIFGEADSREKAEFLMNSIFTDAEIAALEIEVIEG